LEAGIHSGVAKLVQQAGDHRDPFERVILALHGTSRLSAAVKAFRVSVPRTGGKSMTITSNAPIHHGLQRQFHPLDMVVEPRDFDVAPHMSSSLG